MGEPQTLLDEIREKRGYVYPWQEFLAREDPTFVEAYERMWDTIGARSVSLEPRIKQLILVAVVCSRLDDLAMRTQIARALRLGLTPKEIYEAIEVAFLPSGALTLVHGIQALINAMDEAAPVDEGRDDA